MKRLLQVCFIAAMVFGLASCDKDNNSTSGGNGSSAATPSSLVGTEWTYHDGEATCYVSFVSATDVDVNVYTPHGDEFYYGTYTYSGGNGTMNLTVQGRVYEITFTVSGNTMTAHNTPSGDVVLTRVNNQQPTPQPGGDATYPLSGTTWQCSVYDNDFYETYTISFATTNCILVEADSEGHSGQTSGTYNYSGTVTSGQGSITLSNGHQATFTVNGQQATVSVGGRTMIFNRVQK